MIDDVMQKSSDISHKPPWKCVFPVSNTNQPKCDTTIMRIMHAHASVACEHAKFENAHYCFYCLLNAQCSIANDRHRDKIPYMMQFQIDLPITIL